MFVSERTRGEMQIPIFILNHSVVDVDEIDEIAKLATTLMLTVFALRLSIYLSTHEANSF